MAVGADAPRARRGAADPVRGACDAVPASSARAVLGVAVLSAATVVGTPLGLALAVVLLALGAIAARVKRPGARPDRRPAPRRGARRRDRWMRVWWALAAGLALVPVLRATRLGRGARDLVAAALASLAATGGQHWRALGAGLGVMWSRLPQGLVLRRGRRGARGSAPGRRPAARLIAAVLLAIFVPLLASADAAFAQLLDDLTPRRGAIDIRSAARSCSRSSRAAGGALLTRACARRGRSRRAEGRARPARVGAAARRTRRALRGFVALQFTTLFGGERHVLDTAGLTYAEYARSGFGQLLAVAALTLAVVAAARRWARDDGILLNALLAALCLLTLVVLISALKRLGLYEETFGFTRLRLAAHARCSTSARCSC